jgi:hypothetical protein
MIAGTGFLGYIFSGIMHGFPSRSHHLLSGACLEVPDLSAIMALHNWQELVAPLTGIVSAIMALFMGLAWVSSRHRTRPSLPPPPSPEEKPGQISPDPFVHGSSNEKRTALRRAGQPTKVTLSPDEDKSTQFPGWVTDRSVGGLCLFVNEPHPENAILNLRANHAPATVGWIKIEVKRCRPSRDGYELGVQFLTTPTWNVLLLFG